MSWRKKITLQKAGTKKSHLDLMKRIQGQQFELIKRFLCQEKHVQYNHVQTMKTCDQHQKEMLSKKETQERDKKRCFDELIHQRD